MHCVYYVVCAKNGTHNILHTTHHTYYYAKKANHTPAISVYHLYTCASKYPFFKLQATRRRRRRHIIVIVFLSIQKTFTFAPFTYYLLCVHRKLHKLDE